MEPITVAALAGVWLAVNRDGGTLSGDNPAVISPSVESWRPYLEPLLGGLPMDFVLRWIAVESAGNPCAVGSLRSNGPDGNPREMGIVQLYNPDDLNRFGATGAELRAYCQSGTQKLARPLTDAEKRRQAELAMMLIKRAYASAQLDLSKVGASWSEADVLKLAKLNHGLPGLSRQGIPRTATRLGRPPHDWAEFRDTVLGSTAPFLDAGTERYRAGAWSRSFANAERVAG